MIETLDRADDIPEPIEYLHRIFVQLDRMREYGAFGAVPFTPPFLAAARHLFGWTLYPHEIEALTVMDATVMVARAPASASRKKDGSWGAVGAFFAGRPAALSYPTWRVAT